RIYYRSLHDALPIFALGRDAPLLQPRVLWPGERPAPLRPGEGCKDEVRDPGRDVEQDRLAERRLVPGREDHDQEYEYDDRPDHRSEEHTSELQSREK